MQVRHHDRVLGRAAKKATYVPVALLCDQNTSG